MESLASVGINGIGPRSSCRTISLVFPTRGGMCERLKQAVLKIKKPSVWKQLIPQQIPCNPIFFNQLSTCSEMWLNVHRCVSLMGESLQKSLQF